MARTCFVVMAIGTQSVGGKVVDAAQLKATYEKLIRPALLEVDPALEVIRADEVAAQGTVTTDILTRLMYSDLVLVDVTYPNPNVFYELGIRHACRSGTVIIRNKAADGAAPFDIGHQRYIAYEEVLGGEKALAEQLRERMGWYNLNPTAPDNHLLEHAKSSRFNFPQYGAEVIQQRHEGIAELVKALVESDGIMDAIQALIDEQGTAPPAVKHIITALRQDPKAAVGIVSGLLKMGVIDPTKLFK